MRKYMIPISVVAFFCGIWIAKDVLVPILLAFLVAQSLTPIISRLESRMPQSLAILIAMSAMVLLATGTLVVVARQLAALDSQLPEILNRLGMAFTNANAQISKLFGIHQPTNSDLFSKNFESIIGSGSIAALTAISFTIKGAGEITLVLLLTTLLLRYRHFLRYQLKRLGEVNNSTSAGVGHTIDRTVELGQGYVSALATVSLLVGCTDALGMYLIGSHFAALFGLLGGIAVTIPYVGIAVVAPMCTLLSWFITGSPAAAFGVLLVFGIVHFIEGNILSPYIVGSRVNLNPLSTIIAVLIGGQIWGPAGMILFVPIVGLIRIAAESWPRTEPLARILGPISTDDLNTRTKPPQTQIVAAKVEGI